MIVIGLNGIPRLLIVVLSAMPVTMPGRAIGRTSANDSVSRPKKWKRCTASAASVPRISARTVAPNPTWIDRIRALCSSGFWNAAEYQEVVQLVMGHDCARSALKEYRTTMNSGT